MEKMKRIFAMAGVVLLVFLYLMTLVTGALATPSSHEWFIASIAATVLVPIFLYAYSMLYRVLKRQGEDMRQRESAFLKQMELAAKAKAEAAKQTEENKQEIEASEKVETEASEKVETREEHEDTNL